MAMKGYLIDSKTRTVTECEYEYGGDRSISNLIKGNGICIGWQWTTGDVLFVDDEGLLKPQEFFFRIVKRADGQPYAGNGMVCGPDNEDSSDDPRMTMAEVLADIEWLTHADFEAWCKAHSGQAATSITTVDGTTVLSTWDDYPAMSKPK
jgi:hypothetical protein